MLLGARSGSPEHVLLDIRGAPIPLLFLYALSVSLVPSSLRLSRQLAYSRGLLSFLYLFLVHRSIAIALRLETLGVGRVPLSHALLVALHALVLSMVVCLERPTHLALLVGDHFQSPAVFRRKFWTLGLLDV